MVNAWGWFDLLVKGGWVAFILAGLSLVLWYALGFRYFSLKTKYLKVHPKKLIQADEVISDDLLNQGFLKIKNCFTSENIKNREIALRYILSRIVSDLGKGKQIIRSIVIVAPLLGLLGTVIGMIETFSSLQDSALYSQGGGIAAGISQALITTQMGLIVAIPGLLIGRKLDRQQEMIHAYFEQVVHLFSTEERIL